MMTLVWETNALKQLNATRVTSAGVVSSAWGGGFTIVPKLPYTELPEMAASSTGPLLIWQQRELADSQTQLMGLRIYPSGP
jgi:hypothetical protein